MLCVTCWKEKRANAEYLFLVATGINQSEELHCLIQGTASIVKSWGCTLCLLLWSQIDGVWGVERWSWRTCVKYTHKLTWEVREEGEQWSEKIPSSPFADCAESSLGGCPAGCSLVQNFPVVMVQWRHQKSVASWGWKGKREEENVGGLWRVVPLCALSCSPSINSGVPKEMLSGWEFVVTHSSMSALIIKRSIWLFTSFWLVNSPLILMIFFR